ncbi:uncharacterized protein LOC113332862 [Papaver somniferum]|uniref:uncharacterized protein LOC113332862 n=1 Tax=Papaver somniferum TaxID=3469 RepID=UPI000E6F7466|nr:uncharacterized protein LOC113332862 [Papaver somniferum]
MLKQKSRIQWVKEGSTNTNFFHSNIKIRQRKNMICELEDESVTTEDQSMLDAVSEAEEIKQAIWDMDSNSAPGPDSFSGMFYKACWNIIQADFVKAVQYCWRRQYIPKGLNSNFLVLLPKVQGAKKPNQFRPIGLSNFSFKVFTKILSTRMGKLICKLVSPQKVAYIQGRSIQEQILLSSELVNEMKKKRMGGNVGLNKNFSNGGPNGFFSMQRALKQCDPLLPILFILMEEVLSRNLTKLVETNQMQPMVTRNGISPTHLLFADDVFIFSNGSKKSLVNLLKLLEPYQQSSEQFINKSKSKCFADGCTPLRKTQISSLVQMDLTSFPDKYLGVIIHQGRVKSTSVWPMVEMLRDSLAVWRGRLLSFHDRLVLIKSVLCSIPIYNMTAYKWPSSVIKALKDNIRWIIGDGQSISVWFDTWIGECPLIETLGFNAFVNNNLHMKVSNLLHNGVWKIPEDLQQSLILPLPVASGDKDQLIWCNSLKGKFSTASAVNKIRHKEDQDNMTHLLWKCKFSKSIRTWLGNIFHFPNPFSFDDIIKFAKHKSPIVKEIWLTVAFSIMRELWFQKNNIMFDNGKPNANNFKRRIMNLVHYGGYIMHVGNPGMAGFGIIARSNSCEVIGTVSGGLGISTNYIAETLAIIWAIEWAGKLQCYKIIIRSDSKTVVEDFIRGEVPWCFKSRWIKACKALTEINYEHCYMEINFTADDLAKRGPKLQVGQVIQYIGRSPSLACNFLLLIPSLHFVTLI